MRNAPDHQSSSESIYSKSTPVSAIDTAETTHVADYAVDEIIIKFKPSLQSANLVTSMQSQMQATVTAVTQQVGSQLWKLNGMSVEAAIEQFKDHPAVEYIQPNYRLTIPNAEPSEPIGTQAIPNDPGMPYLWGLDNTGQTGGTVDADIDAPEAWDISTGAGVVVGVIDSGVDFTHPDLDDNMWINTGEIAGNGIDDDGNGYVDDIYGYDFANNDNNPYDDNNHGTHVAGTIAAEANNNQGVVGVAPQAKIMALKFIDASGSGSTFDAIRAIEYATTMGADITNNSWGGGSYNPALYDAIAEAEQAGQLFVAAAGNNSANNDITPYYPADYALDNIISVAATDHNDLLASFSSYGSTSVDLAAPGVDIWSTVPGGYDTLNGTSMATPHVSGVAALLLAQDPTLTPEALKAQIIDSVDPVAALDGWVASGGRLNAYEALTANQGGDIYGSTWHDIDGDGIWDGNELGLADWTVYLDQNQNGQLDTGERSTVTDSSGNYAFLDLAPGTYTVAEVVQPGWEQTYPVGSTGQVATEPVQFQTVQPQIAQSQKVQSLVSAMSTTASSATIQTYGEVVGTSEDRDFVPQTDVSGPLIGMDAFRNDPRFADIEGQGFATVILDTGIDLDHDFFGPDADGNGIADRIVYQYDFGDNDGDASDVNGHGSNVSSIVASSDQTHTGMAPGADIIHLKVFGDDGSGSFGDVEEALQWVAENAEAYNIASVNMSLGDSTNWNVADPHYGLGDELAAIAAQGVITVSASGNDFYGFDSEQGVSYPAADPNSLSIGATFDSDMGYAAWSSGAVAYTSDADRITPFSQRHETLTSIFAPGAPITGAGPNGGLVTQTGTSQAAPHIAGIAVLAQQLAEQTLGRRLSLDEFSNLLVTSGVTITDGDDESDNVGNTDLDFKRVDVHALGEAIWALGNPPPGAHTVTLEAGEVVAGVNFGNRQIATNRDNWSFETGDFTHWFTVGNASIETDSIGAAAPDGTYQALISSGDGAVADNILEAFLGLNPGQLDSLGNGEAIEGSAIQTDVINVQAGDILTFDWNFLTNESANNYTYNDFGFMTISTGLTTELADTFGRLETFGGEGFDEATGYGTFIYKFTEAANVTLALGIADVEDGAVNSALLVDNLTLTSGNQPTQIGWNSSPANEVDRVTGTGVSGGGTFLEPSDDLLLQNPDSLPANFTVQEFLAMTVGDVVGFAQADATFLETVYDFASDFKLGQQAQLLLNSDPATVLGHPAIADLSTLTVEAAIDTVLG